MEVKIRKAENHGNWPFEWQPEPSPNGKWYGLGWENIIAKTMEAGLVRGDVLQALITGVTVVTRAAYDRGSHQLTVLEPKGGD